MTNFFNIKYWSKIEMNLENKPNILLSQFSIIGLIVAIIQVVNDTLHGNFVGTSIDIFIALLFTTTYLLNENNYHTFAKVIFSGFITTIIFVFAGITIRETGVYLLFFPIVGVSFLIFKNEQKIIRNISITYTLLLLLILESTHYHPFGMINIKEGIEDNTSYYVNLAVSMLALIFAIYNLNEINKLIEQRRQMIANELKVKNKDLEKINAELDHFVYCTSHDLKAPLSSILGLINLAKLETKDTASLQYFSLIDGRINKLNSFIKDIIDLSRNSRLELVKEKISIKEIALSVLENNQYIVNAETITFDTSNILEEIVEIDRARLEVVLNNLISNAIKYRNKEVESFVKIEAFKQNGVLEININDNGIGIEENHQDKVFEMFYRGNEESEGSGLGLYIVNDVVTKLNGQINLVSTPLKGTNIKLKIPV